VLRLAGNPPAPTDGDGTRLPHPILWPHFIVSGLFLLCARWDEKTGLPAASDFNQLISERFRCTPRTRGRFHKVKRIDRNEDSQSDNYCDQTYRCYPNDQKGQCGRVVVEPMFVHAHEDHSPFEE
jgi:hypothetical protein